MARVRFAASAALVLLLLLGLSVRGPSPVAPWPDAGPAAAVGWPASSALVIAEVVTGGASASDEYVELYNASTSAVDLAGLEVAYVTSSGATVTRKVAWTGSLPVEPHRHVLLANALGVLRRLRRRDLVGRSRRDRWGARAAADRRRADRRGRLGRRGERVRRGDRRYLLPWRAGRSSGCPAACSATARTRMTMRRISR